MCIELLNIIWDKVCIDIFKKNFINNIIGVELVVKIYNYVSKINDLKIYNFFFYESMYILCIVVDGCFVLIVKSW